MTTPLDPEDGGDATAVLGWVTATEAADLWEDATYIETAALASVLRAAHAEAVDYLRGPDGAFTEPETIPESWKVAQVMIARHTWARMRTGNSDDYGPDGMAVSTYPLVLEARAKLRPKRGPLGGLL